MKPTIAVDFDGTIVEHEFPAIGALKPYAKEALTKFRELGYHILIYSCRLSSYHKEVFCPDEPCGMTRQIAKDMVAFLDANEIPYDEIDDGTKGKPLAEFYIDDKGVRFTNNWAQIAFVVSSVTQHQ